MVVGEAEVVVEEVVGVVQPGCSFSAQSESEESEISGIDDLPDVEGPDLAGENDALSNHSDSMGGEELQLEVDDDGL